jgi:alpha-amylase/alpha-mannosidase (GH57 family)
MTPYGHPIVPLLIDLDAMQAPCRRPQHPKAVAYPGGLERARWHMQEGLQVFEKHLGIRPAGVWLSEGGVSRESLELLDEFDMRWSASGEGVWNNSRFLSKLPAQGEEGRRSLFCANKSTAARHACSSATTACPT